MARFRKIDLRLWADAKFRALSRPCPCAQFLWLYLLTGPHTTAVPGLAVVGEAALAEALGWELPDFRKAFAELADRGMVKADWQARLVWIPNAVKYNAPESPNVVRGWAAVWETVPECPLKAEAEALLEDYFLRNLGLGESFEKAFGQVFGKAFGKAYPKSSRKASRRGDDENGEAFGEAFGEGSEKLSVSLPERVSGKEREKEKKEDVSPHTPLLEEKRQRERESDTPPPPSRGAENLFPETDEQPKAEDAPKAPTAEEVRSAWNESAARVGFARCDTMNQARKDALRGRSRDPHWLANWRAALALAEQSPFLRGGGRDGWVPNIDWFLRRTSVAKLVEGAYAGRPAAARSPPPSSTEDRVAAHAARMAARGKADAQR